MAYMSQERKAQIAPAVKAILKRYGVKGTLSTDRYSLSLNIKSGPMDFIGYVPASENEDKSIGVKCSNCAFYCKEMKGCHIVKQEIEPEGCCRLAAIGESLS